MTNEQPSSADGPPPDARHRKSPTDTENWLRQVLRRRLDRHLAADGFRPALTVIGFHSGGAEVLGLGINRPEDAVLGFVLPPGYSAMGVLASSVVATPPQRLHRNAALAIGVDRSGYTVSLLATNDDVIDTHEPEGWLIDACLRSVDRPTPECAIAALAFPVALWLDRLMVAILAASSAEPITWQSVVDLCPVPKRWRSLDPIDLGATLASTTRSWKALRAAAAEGLRSPVGITRAHAAWMDDAMFARWCMGSFPDLASLRSDVEFLAPPAIAEQVALTLRSAWSAFDR